MASLELDRPLTGSEVETIPAVAFSSGSAATASVVQGIVGNGGHILSVSDVYGGTSRYLRKVGPQIGVEATFVDMSSEDPDTVTRAISDAFKSNTKLVWIESPTNPTLQLVDLALVAKIAHGKGALLLVDNTFASPYYQRPLTLGADLVLASGTKYINGHSDVLIGVVVTPHTDLLDKLRFQQKAVGAVPSPFDLWLAQRGAKTLALRMRQHGLNALKVANWLQTEGVEKGWVRKVIYPGLPGLHSALAWKQLSQDAKEWALSQGFRPETGFPASGMVSFYIDSKDGDKTAGDRLLQALRIFVLAESLGGIESLAELPAVMTHAALEEADRVKLGIDSDLIRLSVGIEDAQDLIDDLHQGLQKTLA